MRKIIPYNPALKAIARKLRKDMTFGEVWLWNELKDDKMLGFDFDRQCCIDNFIVDFYSKDLMLAIEIDGIYHSFEEQFEKDEARQQKLESFGVKFLRFSETEVKDDILNILRTITTTIIELLKADRAFKLPKDFDVTLLDNAIGGHSG